MKRSLLKLSVVPVLCVATITAVNAQNQNEINVVTTSVPFLRISPDARAGGMGEVGIATSPDAASNFYNLAKTPFATQKTALGVTYTPWLRDITKDVFLAALSGYHQLDEEQAISVSARYFNLGNIDFVDFSGNPIGSGRPREFSVDLGYSRKIGARHGAGIALRYINSNLGNVSTGGTNTKPGNAVAADLSYFYNGVDAGGQGWRAGATLSNLGSKISYTDNALERDYIPANLGIGTSYTRTFDESSRLTLALDLNKLLVPTPPVASNVPSTDSAALANYRNKSVFSSWVSSLGDGEDFKEIQASAGLEFAYNEQFFARAGYHYEDRTKGNRQYFTAGVGLKYNVIGLNFSYLIPSGSGVTRNPLSNTLRFGLTFDINGQSTGTAK